MTNLRPQSVPNCRVRQPRARSLIVFVCGFKCVSAFFGRTEWTPLWYHVICVPSPPPNDHNLRVLGWDGFDLMARMTFKFPVRPEEVIEHNDQDWWARNCTVASASQQWNNLGWDLTSFDCEIMQWFELVMGAILSQLKFFWKHFIRMEFYLCIDCKIYV